MRAFVLSGGGNRGPLQVGALQALLENQIAPEMIVGCSAGALNAAYLGQEFSAEQLARLAKIWGNTTKEDVYPGNRLQLLWRFLRGHDSLYDNRNFYAFLQRNGTTPALTFGDFCQKMPVYITATHLNSERLHVFGDDPNDRVLDALMASTALPPLHPPWEVSGERYIDGGTVTPLPLRVAIERGATEIYALHIWEEPKPMTALQQGVAAIINRSISTMLRLQAEHDLLLTEVARQVKLYEVRLTAEALPDIDDWSQSERMRQAGYACTQQYLAEKQLRVSPEAEKAEPPWQQVWGTLARGWKSWGGKAEKSAPVPVRLDS